MNASQPTYKFLKGLNQQPDADITDGLVEATDVSFSKVGSVSAVKNNDVQTSFGASVHSLSMEGVNGSDTLFAGVGSLLYAGGSNVLGTQTLSGNRIRFATHTRRLYFVDESGTLRFYDPSVSTAQKVYYAGTPVPTTGCSSAAAGVGLFTGTYNLKVTFTNAHGYAGNPSPATSTPALAANLLDLSAIPTNSDTNYNVTGRQVWIQGGTTPFYPSYVLLTTLSDNTTTTVSSLNSTNVDTTTLLETDNNVPSTGYKFIVNHYGVLLLAGHDENTLVFTKSGRPEQLPTLNAFTFASSGDPIMNLTSWNGVTYVPTRKRIFQMIGSPGTGILQTNFYVKDSQSRFGTIASDSVVPTPYGMFFWSENGIRVFDGNTSEIFSNEIQDEFNGRNTSDVPESLTKGVFSNDELIYSYCYGSATTPNRSLVYSFKTKTWKVHANGYMAFAADQKNDTLYCGTTDGVEVYQNGNGYRAWAVKSKDFALELLSISNIKMIRVDMEGTISLEVYFDDVLVKTYTLVCPTRKPIERLLPNRLMQRVGLRFSGSAKATQDKLYSFQLEGGIESDNG